MAPLALTEMITFLVIAGQFKGLHFIETIGIFCSISSLRMNETLPVKTL
jgi:hypothetical protein